MPHIFHISFCLPSNPSIFISLFNLYSCKFCISFASRPSTAETKTCGVQVVRKCLFIICILIRKCNFIMERTHLCPLSSFKPNECDCTIVVNLATEFSTDGEISAQLQMDKTTNKRERKTKQLNKIMIQLHSNRIPSDKTKCGIRLNSYSRLHETMAGVMDLVLDKILTVDRMIRLS